ncbi:MAG: YwaF family protein [Clostridia bacterium]|nr:YwaF family protein [Clostridia bacterium]
MDIKGWLYSSWDNPSKKGQWGLLHILTIVAVVAIIVALAFIFRKRSQKARNIVIYVLAGLIFTLEMTRRIVNFTRGDNVTLDDWLWDILPRPWCAISCWLMILSPFIRKRFWYTFTSISGLICALIFFAYPEAGFNNVYIEFENFYSIASHALILISAITLITLKYTETNPKHIWKSFVFWGVVIVYAMIESFVLKVEDDPLYMLPGNDAMEIIGVGYGVYLVLWILFISIIITSYYMIPYWVNKRKAKKQLKAA